MKRRTSLASLAIAATLSTAHAQHALPPGFPPELYRDQWGNAHWIWHDWQDVPHVSGPLPPPPTPPTPSKATPKSACYDDEWNYVGGDKPECAGPKIK